MNLNGKRILFIGPRYFDYAIRIKEEMEKNGGKVVWINSNIRDTGIYNSFVYKYISSWKNKLRDNYYKKRIPQNFNADIVFVIKGETLSSEIMESIKEDNPKARYIMYQWDSAKAEPNALKLQRYFDKVITFDYEDAKQYGWYYRPLFYLESSFKSWNERKNDISMIGVIHSERIDLLHKLESFCSSNNLQLFHHLFCTFLGFYKCKYLTHDSSYVKAKHNEITHKSLSLKDTYNIYSDSKFIADYTYPGQTGFTMRTIECMGNHCKLITNNKYIKTADFYSEDNIFIYDINNFKIPEEFMRKSFVELKTDIMSKYSLQGWLKEVLSFEEY